MTEASRGIDDHSAGTALVIARGGKEAPREPLLVAVNALEVTPHGGAQRLMALG